MTRWLKTLSELVRKLRARQSSQYQFVRALYAAPRQYSAYYDRPAYLRRGCVVVCD